MPVKKYIVTLTDDEQAVLRGIIDMGKHSGEKRKRARALLLANENCTDAVIAGRTGLSRRGLEQLRQRFAEEGFEITLAGKPKTRRFKSLDGKDEARLTARAGMRPQPGRANMPDTAADTG